VKTSDLIKKVKWLGYVKGQEHGTICKWQHKRCQQDPYIKYEGGQGSGIGGSKREGW